MVGDMVWVLGQERLDEVQLGGTLKPGKWIYTFLDQQRDAQNKPTVWSEN